MTNQACARVRERIPDLVAQRLDAEVTRELRTHMEGCAECAAHRALAQLLFEGRPTVPPGLAERIKAGLPPVATVATDASTGRSSGGSARGGILFPWWGLAAAAVAAVALGIGIRPGGPELAGPANEVPAFAMEAEEGELWLSEDGEIAGAPTLDGLSEEALRTFLEELDAGGAA